MFVAILRAKPQTVWAAIIYTRFRCAVSAQHHYDFPFLFNRLRMSDSSASSLKSLLKSRGISYLYARTSNCVSPMRTVLWSADECFMFGSPLVVPSISKLHALKQEPVQGGMMNVNTPTSFASYLFCHSLRRSLIDAASALEAKFFGIPLTSVYRKHTAIFLDFATHGVPALT